MNQPAIKFRPSLTSEQIEYLVSVLQSVAPSNLRDQCLTALNKFALKSKYGIVTPSHVATGRKTLEDSLGFSESPAISIESLLKIYAVTPQVLSQSQLDQVQLYRYTNDLMSPEEESSYESKGI